MNFKHLILYTFIFTLCCCHPSIQNNKKEETTKQTKDLMETDKQYIANLFQHFIHAEYSNYIENGAQNEKNVSYEKIEDLNCINHPDYQNLFVYYDTNFRFVVLYTSNEELLNKIKLSRVNETYGPPLEIADSKAGKVANHYIYSNYGFAFSEINNEIVFIEIFPPMTLADYKNQIYTTPVYR